MTDWVLEKITRYVDQVTHENESYFHDQQHGVLC